MIQSVRHRCLTPTPARSGWPTPPRRPGLTLTILSIACVAYVLQQTLVVPALPIFQEDLNTSATWAAWVFTGFLLTSAVATTPLGKLGDTYGKRRLLAISLGIFAVGTVAAALSTSIATLIASRALQGAAGAIFPLSFGIIRDEFPRERVGVALGLLSATFGIGAATGLVLSGVILAGAELALALLVRRHPGGRRPGPGVKLIPESPVRTPSRFDGWGVLTLSVGLSALLLALSEGEHWGWLSAVAALVQPHRSPSLRASSSAPRPADRVSDAPDVEARGRADGRLGDEPPDQDEGDDDRHGADPEQPVPAERLEDDAREHQAQAGAHAEGGREQAQGRADALARELVADDPEREGEDRAGRALQRARADQQRDGVGQRGADRADGEDAERDHEQAALAVGVAELADRGRHNRRGEQEPGEHPRRPGGARVQVALEVGDRRDDQRLLQHVGHARDREDRQREPRPAGRCVLHPAPPRRRLRQECLAFYHE